MSADHIQELRDLKSKLDIGAMIGAFALLVIFGIFTTWQIAAFVVLAYSIAAFWAIAQVQRKITAAEMADYEIVKSEINISSGKPPEGWPDEQDE